MIGLYSDPEICRAKGWRR